VAIDIGAYYEKYLPMVLRRCRRMLGNEEEALDAAQDVFVKLLGAEKRLRGRFPSSLLYTIATNTCLNRIRWKKRHGEIFAGDSGILELYGQEPGHDRVEAKMVMEGILKTESESTRAICFMYYADDMTLREIGEALRMSASGVRKRISAFNARARIRYEFGVKEEKGDK
jgi:RNA polymerase sigma-70 factor (ECF subfamily)